MRRGDGKGPKWSCMAKYAMSITTNLGKRPHESLSELMHNVRSRFIENGRMGSEGHPTQLHYLNDMFSPHLTNYGLQTPNRITHHLLSPP